ncbi:MAG: family efflux transporter [Clostridia bacterium]|jgi:putative MATE family efflux protein|nr:family efflux transporter [Clostridia bacterium]
MRGEEKRSLILQGNLYKCIITLAMPIMLNNFIQTLFNLADAYYVGQLGYVEFAATAFVWPVNFLFISLGIGISIAGTSILSQYIGAAKYDEANKVSSQLIVISCIVSIIFSAVGYFASPFIVKLMGASGDLARFGAIYLRITFLDTPFMFFYFSFNSIMNSQGDTIKPMVLSGISALLNIVLDPIFIFTLHMGIAGAAVATLISKAVLAIIGLLILIKSSSIIRPSVKNFKFDKEIIKQIIKVGLPSTIGQSGASLGFLVLNSFIISYGSVTMAAFGMVNRITSLIMQPAMGIGAAMTAIVGQNLGSNQIDRVKEAFKKSMNLSLYMSITGCILLLIFDKEIIHFFINAEDNPEVISQGITYLKYIAYSMPLMGIFSIFQGVFQGSGHTKYSMALEIGRLWVVRIPMILIFKHFTKAAETGIWFSMSFSNLFVCMYGYWIYRRNKWQTRIIS